MTSAAEFLAGSDVCFREAESPRHAFPSELPNVRWLAHVLWELAVLLEGKQQPAPGWLSLHD